MARRTRHIKESWETWDDSSNSGFISSGSSSSYSRSSDSNINDDSTPYESGYYVSDSSDSNYSDDSSYSSSSSINVGDKKTALVYILMVVGIGSILVSMGNMNKHNNTTNIHIDEINGDGNKIEFYQK